MTFELTEKVADIIFQYVMHDIVEDIGHSALIGGTNIFLSKGHDTIAEGSLSGDEGSFFFIFQNK